MTATSTTVPPRGNDVVFRLHCFDEIDYENGTVARYDADENLAADGIVTGSGRIDGRQVYFVANDYTVKAGTTSTMSIEKQLRIQERADVTGAPILYPVDSAGARITDQSGFFADRYRGGKTFYNQCLLRTSSPNRRALWTLRRRCSLHADVP